MSNIPVDVVFLMLGTNDSHENKTLQEGGNGKGHTIQVFQENLREILRKIILKNKDTIIILCSPIPTFDPLRKELPQFVDAIFPIKDEEEFKDNIVFINQYQTWNNLLQENSKWKKALYADNIHPNENGHLLFTQNILLNYE